ncbi:Protein PHLOEM PROTEIN 2-LIKE A1 [Acorus gramineus]|uniref:Protein PHLOEM PROTEIN 2-LIKE A1 n=1 Tax=Acorus gramineus TaxID=55184 RepID=A0AAV9BTX0_ACOGR|nr:Protein PHLOEM PROTEIN 2-LIKE A1 [Acorus gramineus]
MQKYWVDKSGYNCFTVYARDLSITWSSEQRYWHWLPLNDYSSPSCSEADIAVASLQNVCWLEVQGKLDASHLSPEVTYEVAFLVMMKDSSSGWHDLVTLSLKYPGGDKHDRKVSLNDDNLKNKWSELQVGTFTTSRDIQGDIQFSMFQCGAWKRGLVIKGATIQPAKGV